MTNLIGKSKLRNHIQSCSCNITTNKALQYDPSRTLTLRNKFSADMTRRFKLLKKMITELVGTMDVFGLSSPKQLDLFTNAVAGPRGFAFRTDAEKVADFMAWLMEMEDKHLLTVTVRSGRTVVARQAWENLYIESAYKKGIERAYSELNKAGASIDGAMNAAFFSPVNADAVGLLYTRTFNELKGVTDVMDQQISRILAQGLAEGLGAFQIAKDINTVVDNIGINRARTIARTEIIRAHHVATINTYKSAGIKDVKILAEWSTANDARVCSLCAPLEGTIWPLDKAEAMIPRHPNCRCVAIPYLPPDEESRKEENRRKRALEDGVRKSIDSGKGKSWAGGEQIIS